MELDVRTLFLLFSAGNFFTLLFFVAYVVIYRDRHAILVLFLLNKFIGCIQWILFANRGVLPDVYTLYTANILNIFSLFLDIYCISFATKRFNLKHLSKLFVIPVVASVIFLIFNGSIDHERVILVALIVTVYFLIGGIYLLFSQSVSKLQHFIGYLFIFVAIISLFRANWASVSSNHAAIFANHSLQVLSYISLFLVSSPLAIALLLILKEVDNKQLEELNFSRDRFYSIIAHDLRAPLSNLQLLGYFLNHEEKERDPEEYHQMTQSVYKSARDASRLLENLLKWASSNAGLMVISPESLDVRQIVDKTKDLYESRLREKNLTFINQIEDKLTVFADKEMLDTVIRNFINNAVKYSRPNGKITVLSTLKGKDFCTLGVMDQGIGMSNKIVDQILNGETLKSVPGTANENGSGLGLKLCKEFIEKIGGRLWIESSEGKGTTFWFALPTQ